MRAIALKKAVCSQCESANQLLGTPDNELGSLINYAAKQCSGMLAIYYYPRWQAVFVIVEKNMIQPKPDMNDPAIEYFGMEKKWTDSIYHYERPVIADRKRFFDFLMN